MRYDCVYYWKGGAERGEWRCADAGTRADIERMGYVAHDGLRSIGPPEGPPAPDALREAIRLRLESDRDTERSVRIALFGNP